MESLASTLRADGQLKSDGGRVSASRVRFATIGPGVEPWRSEMLRFAKSIRTCGGTLAGAEIVCYFDRVMDAEIAGELYGLGVCSMLTAPVDPRCAMGNNQIMFDDSGDYDWLVACDCDVAVDMTTEKEVRRIIRLIETNVKDRSESMISWLITRTLSTIPQIYMHR